MQDAISVGEAREEKETTALFTGPPSVAEHSHALRNLQVGKAALQGV
jgi:hypothetical protein